MKLRTNPDIIFRDLKNKYRNAVLLIRVQDNYTAFGEYASIVV